MKHILTTISEEKQAEMIKRNKGKSLLDLYPNIAKEWDYDLNKDLKPEMVASKSYYHVNWVCPLGHKYDADVSSRTQHNSNCPFCVGKKILSGFNDFKTKYPELVKEWDYDKNDIDPSLIFSSSNEKVWWKCKNGHSWKTTIANRTLMGSNCPICTNQKIVKGINDAGTKYPEILKIWDYDKNISTPYEVAPTSKTVVFWKCENGHEWKNSIGNEFNKGFKCSYCDKVKMYPGENDFFSLYPQFKTLFCWDLNKDEYIAYFSRKKYWWKLSCGHSFKRKVADFANTQECPYCSNKKVLTGFNDFETKYPEMLSQWDYDANKKLPANQVAGGKTRIHWICSNGHKWSNSADSSIRNNNNCPYCINKKVFEGFNDLQTCFPEIAVEWDYDKNNFKPNEIVYGSHKRAWWKCKNGHSWECAINSRTTQGTGCPHCAETKGEKMIRTFLETNNISFDAQYSFKNCKDVNALPFDFVLSDRKTIIEYDGI